jgi:two-component system, LytTR family, response regulator
MQIFITFNPDKSYLSDIMEPKLRALIVDDEEIAIKLLIKLLEETLSFSEIRFARSVTSANTELAEFEPDIIFLDIKMPGRDGFTIINDLQHKNLKPGIVFVTAYEQYAVKAIKNQAFDYLLKPVNRKELKQCIAKFIETKKEGSLHDSSKRSLEIHDKIKRIRVNTRTGTVFINPASILYCKAEGNYTLICTGEKLHLCSMNLGKISEQLPGNGFIRVGRSYIINYEHIVMLDRKESQVTLTHDGETVIVKLPRHNLKALDTI